MAALRASANIITIAAEKLHIGRQTLHAWIKDDPRLQEARAAIKEELIDLAESQLLTAIRNGSERSVHFFLDRQGKERGYTTRQEVAGPDGGAVRVKADYSSLSTGDLRAQADKIAAALAALAS